MTEIWTPELRDARGLGITVDAVREKREELYPDYWMFIDKSRPIGEWPAYRVFCGTPQELAVAYALRPDGVIAEMVREFDDPERVAEIST